MKQKLSLVLVILLIISSGISSFGVTNIHMFGSPTSWATAEITELATYDLLRQDAFRDYQKSITRLQFIYLAVRLYESITGSEIPIKSGVTFSDTTDSYALKGASIGITTGIGGGKFGPNVLLTREQLATLMIRSLELSGLTLAKSTSLFTDDSKISPFAKDAVYKASQYGIVKGTDNAFQPTNGAKIEESLVIFKRAYDQFGAVVEKPLLSPAQIAEKVGKAVVHIETFDADGQPYATGSGFIVDASGKVVTNYHVIQGAYSANVKLLDGRVFPVVSVLGNDYGRDVAVLKINGSGLPTVALGNSSRVVQGEEILTLGSPIGLENTLSDGLVSNKNRVLDGYAYIQISAPISPGSSGGVLLNYYGEVIGVTSAGFEGGQNLNLAIPINEVKPYLTVTTSKTLKVLASTTVKGTLNFDNGDSYTGDLLQGMMHGTGTYKWADGDYYVGGFYENMFHGVATMHYSDGTIVKGEWYYDEFMENLMVPRAYARAISTTEVEIGWDLIDNATAYYVYYADSPSGPWYYFEDEFGNPWGLEYRGQYSASLTDNLPGSTVYFAVTSVVFDVESEASTIISVTLPK